jgi:hypothetical protein
MSVAPRPADAEAMRGASQAASRAPSDAAAVPAAVGDDFSVILPASADEQPGGVLSDEAVAQLQWTRIKEEETRRSREGSRHASATGHVSLPPSRQQQQRPGSTPNAPSPPRSASGVRVSREGARIDESGSPQGAHDRPRSGSQERPAPPPGEAAAGAGAGAGSPASRHRLSQLGGADSPAQLHSEDSVRHAWE